MAKSFNPVYQYPPPDTDPFEGELHAGKRVKDIKDMPQSAYGGWWPSFFPSAIGFLVTGDEQNVNVMTISCLVVVNAHPFMVGLPIFIGQESTHGVGPRFSFDLLSRNPEFTVNVPSIDQRVKQRVMICGSISGRDGKDKFDLADFNKIPSRHVTPPIIAECFLNLECRVYRQIELGTHCWIIGQVEAVHLDEEVASGSRPIVWRSMPEQFDNGAGSPESD